MLTRLGSLVRRRQGPRAPLPFSLCWHSARSNLGLAATAANDRLFVFCPIVYIGTRVHEDKAGACRSWITAAKGRLIGYVHVHRGRCPDPTQLGELCAASCDPVRGACHQSRRARTTSADETTDGQIAAIACTRGTVLPATNTLLKALASRAVPG